LWIAHGVSSTHLAPFDLDCKRIGPGFRLRGSDGGGTDVRGIAIDADHRVWVADAASGSLRAFTMGGAQIGEILSSGDPASDSPAAYGDPAGIAAQGVESDARLLLSRGGAKRHALLLVDPTRGTTLSLRPDGNPRGIFSRLGGVALAGRRVYACEAGRRVVQVFRDGDFHYQFPIPDPTHGISPREPCAVAALTDGRSLVACNGAECGAVFIFDPGGGCTGLLASGEAGDSAEGGRFEDISGVAIAEGATDRSSLAFVLDRDGDRVQTFNLDGRCLGAFHNLQATAETPRHEPRRVSQSTPRPSTKGRHQRD
jgi:hypothetical protein